MAIRFISDLHLNHNNILKYDKRPFKTLEEQNSYFIKKWNEVVDDEDDVYILGDIGFGSSEALVPLYQSLKGHKHLIIGNHDRKLLKNIRLRNVFETVEEKKVMVIDSTRITLNHEPITHYDCQFYGGEMYYGHVHTSSSWTAVMKEQLLLKSLNIPTKMYNVCISCPYMDFAPRTREEIQKGFEQWYSKHRKEIESYVAN